MIRNYLATLEYDGTKYNGWQKQGNTENTIQGKLETLLSRLLEQDIEVNGAGRTDKGVHALGQVVAFDSARAIPAHGFMRGLNRFLPDDVRIQRAVLCAPGFEPRFEATEKTYRYLLQHGEPQNPLLRERAYHLGRSVRLDPDAMRAAATQLVGTHDFRAFRSLDDARENSVRTIYAIDVDDAFTGDPSLLAITVRGTAFMKNMVRIMAGTLIGVGRGRIPLSRVPGMLGAEADRTLAGVTAPAHGLTLVRVLLGRRRPSPLERSA